MDNQKEYIICAAIKRLHPIDNVQTNYKDKSCWKQYGKYDDIYQIEIGRRHNDIIQRFGCELDTLSQGFYTSYGRFVDRKEAMTIARAVNQITNSTYIDILFSEDLY